MGGRRFDSVREVDFNADGHPQFESASSAVVSRVYSSLAQLVEHLTVNQVVAGSSPARGAKIVHSIAMDLARRSTRQAHCVVPVLLAVEYREVPEWSIGAPC